MSKGIKQSIFILIFLLVGSLLFSGLSLYQKEEVSKEKENIVKQLTETQNTVLTSEAKVKALESNVSALKAEKDSLSQEKLEVEKKATEAEEQVKNLNSEIDSITREKDKWKTRLDDMTQERDDLVVKLKEASEPQIVYKEKIVYKEREPEPQQETPKQEPVQAVVKTATDVPPSDQEDKYWAEVLKEKAELQIEVNQLKKELTDNSLEIIGLKQTNADLQIELDNIQRDRETVSRNVNDIKEKYEREISSLREDLQKVKDTKGALINNLSLELARAKNDSKFTRNRNDSINDENKDLRKQLQELISTKGELEKTIVRLQQDKVQIEKQLEEREGMIQAKIQEIWQIKESLDETFSASQLMSDDKKEKQNTGVDLQPIRIVSNESAVEEETPAAAPVKTSPGYNGKVISVNEENNFVIVDIGEDDGITLGETLGVYRNAENIATLEVIQIRKDISAADVKEMKSKILQGDIVR